MRAAYAALAALRVSEVVNARRGHWHRPVIPVLHGFEVLGCRRHSCEGNEAAPRPQAWSWFSVARIGALTPFQV